MKLHLPLCLLAVVCLGVSVARAFSEIPEGYTVVPVSSAGDVAAYLNTGSHVFQSDSSLDMTGWASTTNSGGSAIFQVEGDMKVTSADTKRTTFFNGNTTDSALRIENTGTFEMQNGYIKAHTVSFSGNGSSSVNIHGSTSTSTGGAITQATTSSNSGSLVVENQASAVFSDNKASNGGVIYRKYGQLTFDNNKLLNFQNNTATSNGGAIYCMTSATLEVTNNEVAVFSGNSATTYGGAIYAATSAAGTTLSNNGVLKITDNSAKQYGAAQFGTVLFDNNKVLDVSRNSSTSAGGAFYVGTQMTISNSQLVRFNDNKAQSPYATQAGGAIQTGSSGKIFIQNNGTVEFRNNLSSCTINNQNSTSITGNSHLIIADNSGSNGAFALSAAGDTVNIDNNILVEITGNKASVDGGVISGGVATFCGNKELIFTGNDAGSSGGAIYNSILTVSGNDKVVFRNNTRVENGKTVLNSIYALEASLVFCATDKTDSITFYDTVYTTGKNSATVSLNNGGAGRITFSGKYAAADLAARGGNYDEAASRTSVFGQALTVQGGVLEIADSAIVQTSMLSTSAGAAIELNSGTVKGNVYIVSNSALNVSGSSSVTGQIYFYEGADLNITLDASNLSNAALTLGSSLAGSLSSVNFNVNSADLIDGKYKVMSGNGSAFADASKGLSWEDGALYLTVSGSDNVWHVRDNFTYGEAVDTSASQAISLDGGTMRVTRNLASGVTLTSTASTTLELAAGVTLEASALNGLEHTMILSGEGVYNLGNSTAMNATLSNWKGQVCAGDGDKSYTTMTNLDLAGLGERGSSIRLQGVQGSLATGEKTVEADVVLAAGNGIAAVVIDSATAGDSVRFEGAVSSDGAVNFINDAAAEHSYEFSGDVSGWKGQIVSNTGTLNLTYSGDAKQIATDVRAADTGSGSVLNLKVQNADTVVFSGVVKDAPSWNTNNTNRTLNVEIDNSGYETIFRNGIQADTVKLSNASTLVAQKEDGTARVSVTAHKGAQAQLKAVDVTDTGLALHENKQNGETRGLLENAAVVLGLDAPTAVALTADEGSAAAAAVSYTVSNIDFKNTMLTAMAGTGVNLSNVSFDADSALKGDGSGLHQLTGAGNVLTLANNPMEVDAQGGTVTYTTSQLAGFTLAGGAGLLLDASALDLPAVAYGKYAMSIVLAGFTAEDPSVTITGQRWDSVGSVDYSWTTGDVGLMVTFNAMVPEPATSTLSLLALAALAARRRRRA